MRPVFRAVVIPSLVLLAWGCSSNDTPTEPEPGPDLDVASVVIAPGSASLAALGDTIRFTATARNAAGEEVPAGFTWSSTAEAIAVVDTAGLVESRGGGEARIIVAAEGYADTAVVTVTLTTLVWAAGVDGDWHDPGNWRGGVVPTASDTAAITVSGTYEVSLSAATAVARLVLGGPVGTQRLDTGGHPLTVGSFAMDGANLHMDGAVDVGQAMTWRGGAITGAGTLTLAGGGELQVGGGSPTPTLECTLFNGGTVAVVSGARFDVTGAGEIQNPAGSVIDFRSDGSILPYSGGEVISAGDVIKSAGVGVSALGSSGTFSVTGAVEIRSGALRVAGGQIRGPVDIAPGSRLEALGAITLAGDVSFPNAGAVDIDGSVVVGDQAGQTITMPYLTLHSGTVSGMANIAVTDSLVWVRGGIEGEGVITIAEGAAARLVGDEFSKRLSGRDLRILGDLTAGSGLDLLLEQNAGITVESSGRWNQGFGGRIRQTDASGSILQMDGIFTKTDTEDMTVDVAVTCGGSLLLEAGKLVLTETFDLTPTGLIRGGGPAPNPGNNLRLDLSQASQSTLAGTIEVDYRGQPAQLDIAGVAAMAATTVVRIDIAENGDIRGERLIFSNSVALAGTLEITRVLDPELGEPFVVVSTVNGSGAFADLVGVEGFDWIQDTSGVRLYWQPSR